MMVESTIMNDFKNVLVDNFGLQIVCEQINNDLCITGQNDNLSIIVAAPGHIDPNKWVVRVLPGMRYKGSFFDLGCYGEERFDSGAECLDYLINNQHIIYKESFEFVLGEYEKLVSDLLNISTINSTMDLLTISTMNSTMDYLLKNIKEFTGGTANEN